MAAFNRCIFRKKSGRLSSAGPEIQAFVSHCSANLQPILDYFIANFKLKYENSDNVKADRVNTVVFNLHQNKRRTLDTVNRYDSFQNKFSSKLVWSEDLRSTDFNFMIRLEIGL